MIDLDIEMTEKLCKHEIDRADRSGESINPYCLHHSPAHAMLELITRLRQAEKDAARYRWLRDDAYNYLSGPMIFNCDYCGNPEPDDDGDVIAMVGSDVDLAVDKAMQCNK